MRSFASKVLLLAVASSLLAAPLTAPAGHFTQGRCRGTVVAPSVWRTFGSHVLENLLFAYGSLWVSDSTGNRIVRLGPDGSKQGTLEGIPPGGLVVGPDGLIYAGWDNSVVDSILRRGLSKVVRFDAANPSGTLETYAKGFD